MLVRVRLCGAVHSLSLVRINPSLVVFRAAPWRALLERIGSVDERKAWPMPRVSFFDREYSPPSHVRAMIAARLARDDGRRKALLALVEELEGSFQRMMERAEAEERAIARAVARASAAPDSLALSGPSSSSSTEEEEEAPGVPVLDLALTGLESDTAWNAAHSALTTVMRPASSPCSSSEESSNSSSEEEEITTPVPPVSLLLHQPSSDLVL